MGERKERVKDAVEATKTAVRGGLVAGGEIPLLNVAKTLTEDNNAQNIVRNALEEPFNKLLSNAGLDPGEYKHRLLLADLGETGVDIVSGDLCDMIEEGIVDPTGVLTSAVYNAVNSAISILTTEAIIPYNKDDDKK